MWPFLHWSYLGFSVLPGPGFLYYLMKIEICEKCGCYLPHLCFLCKTITKSIPNICVYIYIWFKEYRENLEGYANIKNVGASLVAQWLRICLPMQGTRVQALVWEDPTCCGATRPVSHNYWACTSGACALQQERPRQWEARAPRWRVAPTCRN